MIAIYEIEPSPASGGSLIPSGAPSPGQMLVGNPAGNAYDVVSMSGAATISSTGVLTLANTAVTPGSYTNVNLTVGADGRIIAVANGSAGVGTVTSVSIVTANGISGSVATATTTPAITLTLGAITPSSIVASGTIAGSNLSGTNTGDQTNISGNAGTATSLFTGRTLAITGDLTWTSPSFNGSANVTAAGTLANTAVTPSSYGSSTDIPTFTVDSKGRLTAASTAAVVAPAGTLTGATLAAGVTASSLTSVGTLTGGATGAGFTIALGTSTLTGDLPFDHLTPASGASLLLGRGDSGSGDFQEITLGTNLSMSGTTLNATGGGVSIDLQTDGVSNTSQTVLNLISGTNITLTADGAGGVTIDSSGSGAGDMTKAVYDPQNLGFISGGSAGVGVGGALYMDSLGAANSGSITTRGNAATGGNINTSGSASGGAAGGAILTYGDAVGGGAIQTYGGTASGCTGGAIGTGGGSSPGASGGQISTFGGSLPGGPIDTSNGGGQISTVGTGLIELGLLGTRTSLTGNATADRAIALPDASGTVLLANGSGTSLTGVTFSAIVPNTPPAAGGLLVGNAGGTAYAPVAMSGAGTLASTGTLAVVAFTVANEATDTTCFPVFVTATTGSLGPKTNAALTFNSATASLGCTTFVGALTGNASTATSAAALSISGQTGLLTFTGLASTSRAKAVRDAADTILELGGSYTPSGTWTSLTMVTPVLGTPASGVLSNCTSATQTAGDNSTKLATTAYVDAAVGGQNYKEAVKYATTAALPSVVYANGSSGVGATLTGVALAAISVDSGSPSVGDRLLVKNQASGFQNGIYLVTQTGSGIAVFILTRTTDADQAAEWKTGDSMFVTAGTTQSTTTWAYTGIDSPTMGTTDLTFVQVAGQGSLIAGTGISIAGTTIAINTAVTVDLTTAQTLTNKRITSRVETLTDAATVTPASDANDGGILTELSQTTTIANPTGTSTNFQKYVLRIKSTTTRAISFGNQYRGSATLALPTATTGSSKTDYLMFQRNTADSTWDFLAYNPSF